MPNPPHPEAGGPRRGEDERLARRLRDGDMEAFDAFIRAQWPRLVYYLTDRTRDRELAEDLAQEALGRLWERHRSLNPARSVVSYLYEIARNLAIDELRKVQVRSRWRDRERHHAETLNGITPLQQVQERETLQALQRALAGLPPRRREAFMLVHVHHLSYRDAAAVMGNAPQTVANQVAAAVAELRRTLEPFLRDQD